MMRDQGSAILLNMYYGPVMNASFGVARQVSSATNQLSAAMAGAFAPEITACEGRGDRARMLMLSQCVSKLGTILMILLAVPLIIETEYVLRIWLKTPPEHAVSFCRLILTMFLIDRLSSGHMLAVSAHGKIARYQATLGTILL
jgi:O-antigen/teichoic acid export membrane protein